MSFSFFSWFELYGYLHGGLTWEFSSAVSPAKHLYEKYNTRALSLKCHQILAPGIDCPPENKEKLFIATKIFCNRQIPAKTTVVS